MRRREWAFRVQACGLVAFACFALAVPSWLVWRAVDLYRHNDAWLPAAILSVVLGVVYLFLAGVLTHVFLALGWRAEPRPREPALIREEDPLIESVFTPATPRMLAAMAILGAFSALGLFAWAWQVHSGLGVTGLDRPVFWGIYIVDFVFFIGISHAGTLVSAILRIARAEWRRAITRMAEAITVLVLFFGAWNILLDLGRVDRLFEIFKRGRLESPLLWDMCSITTYLFASLIYLYLPLIPDVALLERRAHGWRRHFYHLLAFGWTGSKAQHRVLERAISVMAVLVVPIAVSVHTVVSWVFSMTIQPMWHSTIFGPYFVVGAIFSGIAALLISMALVRRLLRLEAYIRPVHFSHLGVLLMVMACLWIYFTLAEHITVLYGREPAEMAVLQAKLAGPYAAWFWTMVTACFIVPVAILARSRTRTPAGTVVASICVCAGMWIERFTIVVPTLEQPRLRLATTSYVPTWVELSLLAGALASFSLLYILFTRLFPIISIWEIREGQQAGATVTADRIRGYFPSGPDRSALARGRSTRNRGDLVSNS